jgi:hypothetical protein
VQWNRSNSSCEGNHSKIPQSFVFSHTNLADQERAWPPVVKSYRPMPVRVFGIAVLLLWPSSFWLASTIVEN